MRCLDGYRLGGMSKELIVAYFKHNPSIYLKEQRKNSIHIML